MQDVNSRVDHVNDSGDALTKQTPPVRACLVDSLQSRVAIVARRARLMAAPTLHASNQSRSIGAQHRRREFGLPSTQPGSNPFPALTGPCCIRSRRSASECRQTRCLPARARAPEM